MNPSFFVAIVIVAAMCTFPGESIASIPDETTEEVKQAEAVDLDGDGKVEYIIGIQSREKEVIPNGLLRICSSENCAGNDLLRETRIGDYFDRFEFVSLNQDRTRQILAWGMSGAHHTDLSVLNLENGKIIELFAKGSAAGVWFKSSTEGKSGKPEIWVGRANWSDPKWDYAHGERLWETHVWEGKQFVYDEQLSTSPLKSEMEEISGFVGKYQQLVEAKKN